MNTVKSPVLFYIAIAITAVALLFCIYHAIPNIYHIPVPADARPTEVHYKYMAFFGGLAVLGVIGALITRPKAGAK